MKKGLSLLLAAAMLSGSLAGCAQNAQTQDTGQDKETGMTEEALTEQASAPENDGEKMEISYVSFNCGAIEEGNWAEKYLEDKYGVEIRTSRVDVSNVEQTQLMLASGEMPDCGWINNVSPQEMYDQGLIRTVPEEMIREYAPSYAALLDENPFGWKLYRCKEDGNLMSVSGFRESNLGAVINASSYRLDWLEKIGIEPNGELIQLDEDGRLFLATEPFTKSQFEQIMDGFTNKDPDGNGQDDTFGMIAGGNMPFSWVPMMGMFGVTTAFSMNVDGVAEDYYVTPAYHDFLEFAAKMYKKGYIDREFATLTLQESWEKITAEKAGYSGSGFEWTGPAVTFAGTRPPNTIVNNTEGTVVMVPTEVNDDKTGGTPVYASSNFSNFFYVNKNVDDKKLAKILEIFIENANFNREDYIALRYGEEGTHFDYTGTNSQGKSGPTLKEDVTNGGAYGLSVYGTSFIETKESKALGWDSVLETVMSYSWGDFKKQLLYPYRWDAFNETGYSELKTLYGPTIDTLVKEYFFNVICGEVELDATWDDYIASLEAAGYSEIRKELQKAPLYEDLMK